MSGAPDDQGPEIGEQAPQARGRARLLLSNVVKDHNLAALLRTADAFGVDEVVVVGKRRIARAGSLSVGMAKFLRRRSFLQLDEAVAHLRGDGFRIVGIEVDEAAVPVEEQPFHGDTAFVLGNEGDGLSPKQRAHCDGLVRIRQFGHTASLNVHVAGAIVLHQFALWARMSERPIRGAKYVPPSNHEFVPEGHEYPQRFARPTPTDGEADHSSSRS